LAAVALPALSGAGRDGWAEILKKNTGAKRRSTIKNCLDTLFVADSRKV